MKFDELCEIDSRLKALLQEAGAFRVLLDGKPERVYTAERAAQFSKDLSFCKYQLWHGLPGDRGEVGLKFLANQVVDSSPALHLYRDLILHTLHDAIPACLGHDGCRADYPVPPPSEVPTTESLARPKETGFFDLLDSFAHTAGGPKPTPIEISRDAAMNPIFFVHEEHEGRVLWNTLRFQERLDARTITPAYANHAIYFLSPEECTQLACMEDFKKVTATLSSGKIIDVPHFHGRPVILTFEHAALAAKLLSVGITVGYVPGIPESQEKFREQLQYVYPAVEVTSEDLPVEALDGWLGEVCRTRMGDWPRALAWPALVTCAGALVSGERTNLYCALVGEPGCGKSEAIKRVLALLDISNPPLLPMKSGSAEGFAKFVGNAHGEYRLFFPDELLHTMEKAQIDRASFATFLNTAFDESEQFLTIAHGKEIHFNAQLSILGGIVTETFGDAFGGKTTGGLYDRFIFGLCPRDVSYLWQPFEGGPALKRATAEVDGFDSFGTRPVNVSVDPAVWSVKKQWIREHPEMNRGFMHAIRVATICAAFDGRSVLYPDALGPAKVFAEYQLAIRKRLRPNPGENPEGILTHKFIDYLDRSAPNEQAVGEREMLRTLHAYDFGPSVAERALRALEANGDIERFRIGRKRYVRRLRG